MDISIKVEKGNAIDEEFFTNIGKLVRTHAWYLNMGETTVEDGFKLERLYSGLEVTKIKEEENNA